MLSVLFKTIVYFFSIMGVLWFFSLLSFSGPSKHNCDILKGYDSYESATRAFMETWDKHLGDKIAVYEATCLKDINAYDKTYSLIEEIENEEKIFQLEILKTIVDDNRTRKAALIKAEYLISRRIDDVNIYNEHIGRAVDLLLNECDDSCIDEIFKTGHNLIFDESLDPCRIIKNDFDKQSADKQSSHLDFLRTYCKRYLQYYGIQ